MNISQIDFHVRDMKLEKNILGGTFPDYSASIDFEVGASQVQSKEVCIQDKCDFVIEFRV